MAPLDEAACVIDEEGKRRPDLGKKNPRTVVEQVGLSLAIYGIQQGQNGEGEQGGKRYAQ